MVKCRGWVKQVIRLFLNLVILIGLFALIRYGYILFTQKVDPALNSIFFIGGIIGWFLLIKLLRSRYKKIKPTFKLTALSAISIILVFTFAGVAPLAVSKDNIIERCKVAYSEWSIERAEATRKVEVAGAEREASDKRETKPRSELVRDLEYNVVELVNAIRADRGSPPLIWDETLYGYSKNHSEAMAKRGELFHTPEGMPYAENCWGGEGSTRWDATDIVGSWMASDMHRTWLLCPNLKHVAVGIARYDTEMYASWTFWVGETNFYSDWWYCNGSGKPPEWWY